MSSDEYDDWLSDNKRELQEEFCEKNESEFRDFVRENYEQYVDSFQESRDLERTRL
jgi:hypothetical protein